MGAKAVVHFISQSSWLKAGETDAGYLKEKEDYYKVTGDVENWLEVGEPGFEKKAESFTKKSIPSGLKIKMWKVKQ